MSIEAMKMALDALDIAQVMLFDLKSYHQPKMLQAYEALRQAISEAEQPQPCCKQYETCTRPCTPRGEFIGRRAAQRQPLTDEEMYLAIRPLFRTDALATNVLQISKDEYRAIEAAHGITGEKI